MERFNQNVTGNTTMINQKMNMFNFNGKNGALIVNEMVNNITINGSKNKILVKNRTPNIIVNGSKNEINIEHRNGSISNIIFNGNHNQIICNRKNINFNKIDNGFNNKIELTQNNNQTQHNQGNFNNGRTIFESNTYDNSGASFRINNSNSIDTNIYEFINNITGNLNMNIQLSQSGQGTVINTNTYSEDSGFEISESNGSHSISDEEFYCEEEEVDHEVDEEYMEALREEEYKRLLNNMREQKINEMNIFQFKNRGKFIDRIDDTCAICLEKFKNIDLCKQFACDIHFFHKNCLDTWLDKSNYCPLCKYDLMDNINLENDDC